MGDVFDLVRVGLVEVGQEHPLAQHLVLGARPRPGGGSHQMESKGWMIKACDAI